MAELQEHFKMNYKRILANANHIVKGNKFRITVLSELLVRLEYSETGLFEDRPTELVMNRKFPVCQFEKKEDNKYVTIKTSYFTLTYQKEMPFVGSKVSPDQYLRIDLNGTDKYWFFNHPEVRNFGGSTFSLDGADGNAKYGRGLYSTDGFVSLDDSKTLIFNEDGTLGKRSDKRIDTYVFMYKRDFGAALRDYFTLTGYPPLIPRYALGVWWNRNIVYDSKDLEKLVYKFNKNRIPLSIIMLGDKWHRQMSKMISGLSFDEKLFKRPKRMTDFLHSKNIRLAVKVNPMEGISKDEDYFLPFKNASGLEGDLKLPFNVFNKNVLSAYFDYLIHPLMNYGVDFFWIDYDNINDKTNLRALTHYHFNDFNQITNRRGITLARNAGIAAHRYPIHYTGETIVSWKNLEMLPTYNSTASNLGLSWISNDIGGYTDGIEDGELYSRFVQFGCFSPILRLSADEGRYYKREPWRWDIKTYTIVKDYLQLRHKLIPYIYSEAYKYHKFGRPLVKPIYATNPEFYDDVLYRNEYYFGGELLVCPIVSRKDYVMDRVLHNFYIPEGTWYDFVTGKKFPGGKNYITFFRDEEFPVFAKSGAIIPMGTNTDLNDTTPPDNMEIHIFPGKSNTYTLFEDDGESDLYRKDFYLLTEIEYNYLPNNYSVIIRAKDGKSGIIPEKRNYKIIFRNTKRTDDVEVYSNRDKVSFKTYVDGPDFVVEVNDVKTIGQLTISCKGKDIEIDAVHLINRDIEGIISDLQISTEMKEEIDGILFIDMTI